jgi:hypothetical protein
MTRRILLIAALVVVAAMTIAEMQSEKPAQKSVKRTLVAVDSMPPPSTLAEMVSYADAVVVARATGNTRLKRGQRDELHLDSTHSFVIEEVIKYSSRVPTAGEVLDLDIAGGTKEYESYIRSEVVDGWDTLRPNQRYLIFVRYVSNDFGERLVPCWSAAGIFNITGGAVKSLDLRFPRYKDKASPTFVDEVKAAEKGIPRRER